MVRKNLKKTHLVIAGMVSHGMNESVYKIFTETEWEDFQEKGLFKGSVNDLSDGFIHLSLKQQVNGVIERYFLNIRPLYIAEFTDPDFIQRLKWEAIGSNDIYPHLYNADLLSNEVTSFVILPN